MKRIGNSTESKMGAAITQLKEELQATILLLPEKISILEKCSHAPDLLGTDNGQ
jgi:hypothetical protein